MNIVLIGYRCCGKSSVGRKLAGRLGFPFEDTDRLVERQTGIAIPRIVAERGWEAFREAERAAIQTLADRDRTVLALGGGAVLDARNVEALKPNGFFVWLSADLETIRARMERDEAGGSGRPALTGAGSLAEIGRVLAEREPLYRAVADLAVDTSRIGPDGVVAAIVAALEARRSGAEKGI